MSRTSLVEETKKFSNIHDNYIRTYTLADESLMYSQRSEAIDRARSYFVPLLVHLWMVKHPIDQVTVDNNLTDIISNWIIPTINYVQKGRLKTATEIITGYDDMSISVKRAISNLKQHHGYKTVNMYWEDMHMLIGNIYLKLDIYAIKHKYSIDKLELKKLILDVINNHQY